MRKMWLLILMMSFLLVGCVNTPIVDDDDDDDKEKPLITLSEVLGLVNETKNHYLTASNIDILLETEKNNEMASLRINYEIDGFTIENFKYTVEMDSDVYETYIKEGIQYINFNNQKSQKAIDRDLLRKVISEYSFNFITENFFKIHTNDYFNCLKVVSEKDGLVMLTLDKTKTNTLETLNRLSDELFSGITVESIEVKINYLNNEIVNIESVISSIEGAEIKFLLNFKANTHSIFNYPDDLADYPVQE